MRKNADLQPLRGCRPPRFLAPARPIVTVPPVQSAATDQSPPKAIATSWPGLTIRLPEALAVWQSAAGRSNRTVAVVDYGFVGSDPELGSVLKWRNHAELTGEIGEDDNPNGFVDDFHGWDFIDNDHLPSADNPDDDHGTDVATVLGARATGGSRFIGVAPNAELMLIRWSGEPHHRDLRYLVKAIQYAVGNGAHIINLSASWPVDPEHPVVVVELARLRQALDRAVTNGILLVVAVRNYPALNLDDPAVDPHVAAMFDHPNIICVTGLRPGAAASVVRYGSYGRTTVDIAAPAEITGPFDGNASDTVVGSSYSAAIVSGAASLVWGLMPRLRAAEVRALLLGKARKLTVTNGQEWGHQAPAVKNGALDLSFVEAAFQSYREGVAYESFFPANARDRAPVP